MGIRFFQLKYVANLKQVGHGKRRIDKSVFNLYLIDSWVTSQGLVERPGSPSSAGRTPAIFSNYVA